MDEVCDEVCDAHRPLGDGPFAPQPVNGVGTSRRLWFDRLVLLHKLVRHYLQHGGDDAFYRLQAVDAIAWLRRQDVPMRAGVRVLDLGCGSGIFGGELLRLGCAVTFADEYQALGAAQAGAPFKVVNIDRDDLALLGRFDLVICSNVLEHLAKPEKLLDACADLIEPNGHFYLSWTNWLSPWGGHDFSPLHYLGPRLGPRLWDRWVKRPRALKPFENLYPTHIGATLRSLRRRPALRVLRVVPRYYSELAFLMRVPVLREFAAWNCAVLIGRV